MCGMSFPSVELVLSWKGGACGRRVWLLCAAERGAEEEAEETGNNLQCGRSVEGKPRVDGQDQESRLAQRNLLIPNYNGLMNICSRLLRYRYNWLHLSICLVGGCISEIHYSS